MWVVVYPCKWRANPTITGIGSSIPFTPKGIEWVWKINIWKKSSQLPIMGFQRRECLCQQCSSKTYSFNTRTLTPVLTLFLNYRSYLIVYSINLITVNFEANKSSIVLICNTLIVKSVKSNCPLFTISTAIAYSLSQPQQNFTEQH